MELTDIKHIATGFINATRAHFGIGDELVEKKAEKRYEICLGCDTISDDHFKCDKEKGGCNCPLAMRTRSDKGCPKGYWQ